MIANTRAAVCYMTTAASQSIRAAAEVAEQAADRKCQKYVQ